MQAEVVVKDMQTSPRERNEKIQEEIISAIDVMHQVTENLVADIVQKMPFKIQTDTQETITEISETTDKNTQTQIQSEQEQSQGGALPYEIHIQTTFVLPEESMPKSTDQTDSMHVIEIEKSFVTDASNPDLVREIEPTAKDKVKKSKSKSKSKKKKNTNLSSNQVKSVDEPKLSDINSSGKQDLSIHEIPTDNLMEKEQKPTFVTLNITKTTVYETSNLISKERRPHGPSVAIEELLSEEKQNPGIFVLCTSNFLYIY